MDCQSNQNQKGITYLNTKAGYRLLKVLYILILGLGIGVGILVILPGGIVEGWQLSVAALISMAVLIILEIAKRSLYYIVIGRVFPNR